MHSRSRSLVLSRSHSYLLIRSFSHSHAQSLTFSRICFHLLTLTRLFAFSLACCFLSLTFSLTHSHSISRLGYYEFQIPMQLASYFINLLPTTVDLFISAPDHIRSISHFHSRVCIATHAISLSFARSHSLAFALTHSLVFSLACSHSHSPVVFTRSYSYSLAFVHARTHVFSFFA